MAAIVLALRAEYLERNNWSCFKSGWTMSISDSFGERCVAPNASFEALRWCASLRRRSVRSLRSSRIALNGFSESGDGAEAATVALRLGMDSAL